MSHCVTMMGKEGGDTIKPRDVPSSVAMVRKKAERAGRLYKSRDDADVGKAPAGNPVQGLRGGWNPSSLGWGSRNWPRQ